MDLEDNLSHSHWTILSSRSGGRAWRATHAATHIQGPSGEEILPGLSSSQCAQLDRRPPSRTCLVPIWFPWLIWIVTHMYIIYSEAHELWGPVLGLELHLYRKKKKITFLWTVLADRLTIYMYWSVATFQRYFIVIYHTFSHLLWYTETVQCTFCVLLDIHMEQTAWLAARWEHLLI